MTRWQLVRHTVAALAALAGLAARAHVDEGGTRGMARVLPAE